MKYQLINQINNNYSAIEQVLTNRHIPLAEVSHYLNTTDNDINSPEALGQKCLMNAVTALIQHIKNNDPALVICDCDADGFTSAAILINYLHDLFPTWVETQLKWWVHEGKQHGLNDCMEYIRSHNFKLVICPDSASNDYDAHANLKSNSIDVIVLDHHLADKISEDAIIINNQLSDYPNKELSGAGVTWQFCRYIDGIMKTNYADDYVDLVALGDCADMMSLTSIETKHLINKGFEPNNVHNPYIYEMWQKNKFKLGEHIMGIDAAFYIIPMINAVQRSGTIEEKELLFKSMLKHEAFKMIDSTKRGCKGEKEKLVEQAVRLSTNVKNRQTRIQDTGMELLEKRIEKDNLLVHKVLLFTLEEGELDRNVAGLVANKLANKYQRPCCVLFKTIEDKESLLGMTQIGPDEYAPEYGNRILYEGSARGYEITGVTDFKGICDAAGAEYTAGHNNAFGVCIAETSLENFLVRTDEALASISAEPIYYVDYIYDNTDINSSDILTIANLKSLWGKDMDEALIAIKGLKVTQDMVSIYRKTTNTLKITTPNNISIMKFNATEEECDLFMSIENGYIAFDIIGTCKQNEWNGNVSPQIFITDYEIVDYGKYIF